ncbi:MAG: hypothetical protein HUJ93_02945 [Bacteroidales bacterium]|nr:hypothetical protein [Bacteroidales bacterium]
MLRESFKKHPLPFLAIAMLAASLPMMLMRTASISNELRYLSIVEEALREGHFFTLYNHGAIYSDKPPLYFWGLMLMRLIFGKNWLWAGELLFSFLPTIGLMWVCDRFLSAAAEQEGLQFTLRERVAAMLVVASGGYILFLSVFLRMDTLMCLFIMLAIYQFYRMYIGSADRLGGQWILGLWVFLALFTKGPVGFLMPPLGICTFLLLRRKGKEILSYMGWRFWAVLAVGCAVWFSGVAIEGGKEYLESLLVHQTAGRMVNAFNHKEPIYYYIYTILYVIFPYTLALIPIYFKVARKNTVKGGQRSEFALVCLIFSTAVFVGLSLSSSKLAIYLVPVYPLMAVMLPYYAAVCRKNEGKVPVWLLWGLAIPCMILLLVCLAYSVVAIVPNAIAPLRETLAAYPFILSWQLCFGVAAAACALISAIFLLLRRRSWDSGAIALAFSLYLLLFSAGLAIGQGKDILGYEGVCNKVAELTSGNPAPKVNTIRCYRPENMDYYLGYDIFDYGREWEPFFTESHSGEVLIVKQKWHDRIPELAKALEFWQCTVVGEHRIYLIP